MGYFSAKDYSALRRRCFPRQSWISSGETAKRCQQDGMANATGVKLLAPRRIYTWSAHRTAACTRVQRACALLTGAQSGEVVEGICFPNHQAEQATVELGSEALSKHTVDDV
eukprot:gnl/TRDRNA2_/TRDRNA2_151374_c0_seq1.p1 gnl/TRDRNA2_/TRDRNA2_151374_c0~~gnl/TRDRNA2_/TRDRNA2_151374_c0_seq1.p1  ORF type:complete len:112 (-),score=8.91 gnl/TRDRNA2_/TRDRNA2_151374_c0_seq1:208-543(-)